MSPTLNQRTLVASVIGIAAGGFTLFAIRFTGAPGGDFGLSWIAARDVLAGRNPYPHDLPYIPYPLTAALAASPFVWLSKEIASAAFMAISTFLMAVGITARKGWKGLWAFASFQFFSAAFFVQWSPLSVAAAFFPYLAIGAFKPQLGLPALVASRKSTAITIPTLIVLISLVIRPTWPLEWFHLAAGYPNFIPILYGPGWIVLVLVFWLRRRDAQLLLAMAAVPQRWFYDPLLLWLIPESETEYLLANLCSWAGGVTWVLFGVYHVYDSAWTLIVISCYVPMLIVVIHRIFSEKIVALSIRD